MPKHVQRNMLFSWNNMFQAAGHTLRWFYEGPRIYPQRWSLTLTIRKPARSYLKADQRNDASLSSWRWQILDRAKRKRLPCIKADWGNRRHSLQRTVPGRRHESSKSNTMQNLPPCFKKYWTTCDCKPQMACPLHRCIWWYRRVREIGYYLEKCKELNKSFAQLSAIKKINKKKIIKIYFQKKFKIQNLTTTSFTLLQLW